MEKGRKGSQADSSEEATGVRASGRTAACAAAAAAAATRTHRLLLEGLLGSSRGEKDVCPGIAALALLYG